MPIETEIKFRTDKQTWHDLKTLYQADHQVHHIEHQTNQYYNTAGNELNDCRIGLRLRILDNQSILTIKRDTKDAHKREEIEETYPGHLDTLPPDSPALQALLDEIGTTYDQIVPLVMLRAERTVFLLDRPTFQAEVCFDDVSILDVCKEHKLYEIEFELLTGSEQDLLNTVAHFRDTYGDRIEQSAISKLQYALELTGCQT
ncbi:MAG TPA: CYTH domain-containing protein [Bacilli bacterium]|nr:CYTH domain-containing protein [Bacilli bacterium]